MSRPLFAVTQHYIALEMAAARPLVAVQGLDGSAAGQVGDAA